MVIDFVGLARRDHREQVLRTLEAALADDPSQGREPLGWTRLGHFELARPRRGRSLADAMLDPACRHKKPITLAYEALRRLQREARAVPVAAWRLRAAPSVVLELRGAAASALKDLETRLGRAIAIEPVDGMDGFDIAPR